MAIQRVTMPTLPQVIDEVPPFIVAAMAKVDRKPLSRSQLAERSGLSLRMVERLAVKTSWEGVNVDVCGAFAEAACVDLFKPFKVRRFLLAAAVSENPLKHLSPAARKTFNRCLEGWIRRR